MSADWASGPLSPFGRQLRIGLEDGLTTAGREEVQRHFLEDGLLLVRDLNLTMEQQQEFCRTFGPIPESRYENFYVSNQRADGFLGTKELQWHNDVPYLPSPYLVAALHAVDVDPDATSTKFVSGIRAYDCLPESLKQRLNGLNALQVRQRTSERRNQLADLEPGDLCTVHPVIRYHQGTGRPYLFVNENMTACIIGMSEHESDALLAELFSYLYADEAVYEHHWQPGDLVVWDNLALQHARGSVGEGARTLQRVTCTRFTYIEQYPADSVGEDLHNTNLLVPAA
jgi:taurine dioxygenase